MMPLCLFQSCILIFFLAGPPGVEVAEVMEAEVEVAAARTGRLGAVAWDTASNCGFIK